MANSLRFSFKLCFLQVQLVEIFLCSSPKSVLGFCFFLFSGLLLFLNMIEFGLTISVSSIAFFVPIRKTWTYFQSHLFSPSFPLVLCFFNLPRCSFGFCCFDFQWVTKVLCFVLLSLPDGVCCYFVSLCFLCRQGKMFSSIYDPFLSKKIPPSFSQSLGI